MNGHKDMLLARSFANGVRLHARDGSRRIAGDRWLVKVEVEISLARETALALLPELGLRPDDLPATCSDDGKISRVIRRERHFVADSEMEQVRGTEMDSLLSHLDGYLARRSFAGQLIRAVVREEQGRREAAALRPSIHDHLDEDDGPADFSSLFRE